MARNALFTSSLTASTHHSKAAVHEEHKVRRIKREGGIDIRVCRRLHIYKCSNLSV